MIRVVSPVDGQVYVERPLASARQVSEQLESGRKAQREWARHSVAERGERLLAGVGAFLAGREVIERELTLQMGRPIAQCSDDVDGLAERARHLVAIAEQSLAPLRLPDPLDLDRFVTRDPLGTVMVLAPWNHPYLCAVNAVVPALMAGNAVLLRHSTQTPLCAERMVEAFGPHLPEGLFSYAHADHELTARVVSDPRVDHVAFTGSVEGGRAIHRAAAGHMKSVGLALGGKDPAYVRRDADVDHAVEALVDGAFSNAGQGCSSIERIYVHGERFDRFVEAFVGRVGQYRLGDPTDPGTTLGPLVRVEAAQRVRGQVAAAVAAGARQLVDTSAFADDGGAYLAPQVLVEVNHSMDIMMEETFGPAVGIMSVSGDEEAVIRMNDSRHGRTAVVFTADQRTAMELGQRVDTGAWLMNRCGCGPSPSPLGYEPLTRPKSFQLRPPI